VAGSHRLSRVCHMTDESPVSSAAASESDRASMAPQLSVLIVNYNSWELCVDALESLQQHRGRDERGAPISLEVIVVDNNSPQADPALVERVRSSLRAIGGELILHDENGGYSKGMNLAYARSRGRYVLVSNPDVVFMPGCVEGMMRYLRQHDDVGAAAPGGYWDRGLDCRLPPNILPTVGDLLSTTLAGVSRRALRRYSRRRTAAALRVWDTPGSVDLVQLSGACFMMDRAFIERIGFFDERFPLYYEDTDLSVRIRRAGKRIVQVGDCHLVHLYNRSGQTAQETAMARYWISRRSYYRKWYGWPGQVLHDTCRWFLATPWAVRRAARVVEFPIVDAGASEQRPLLQLPRAMDRFLVEISLDPRFYLAAGTFGSGDHWSPSDSMFRGFGPTTFYFRVCELSGGEAAEVGVYRYTRVHPEHWNKRAQDAIAASAE